MKKALLVLVIGCSAPPQSPPTPAPVDVAQSFIKDFLAAEDAGGRCIYAGLVAAEYARVGHPEEKTWRDMERVDCHLAGLPTGK